MQRVGELWRSVPAGDGWIDEHWDSRVGDEAIGQDVISANQSPQAGAEVARVPDAPFVAAEAGARGARGGPLSLRWPVGPVLYELHVN